MEKEKVYSISENVVKGLLAYLQEKPFKEVAGGITALSQLKEIRLEKKEPELVPVLNKEVEKK